MDRRQFNKSVDKNCDSEVTEKSTLNRTMQELKSEELIASFSDAELVVVALISYIDEIRKCLAAMNAFALIEEKRISVPQVQDSLWEINVESVWRRLITDVAKLFDKASTCGKTNCSLKQLRELCLEPDNAELFPNREEDPLIVAIGQLQDQYEKTVSTSTRNQQVAHHDLELLKSGTPSFIKLSELNNLIDETTDIISNVASKLLLFDVVFPPLEDMEKHFEKAIKSMTGAQENG